MVGAPGFEPGASCAQGRRATRLRYAPTCTRNVLPNSKARRPDSATPIRQDSLQPALNSFLLPCHRTHAILLSPSNRSRKIVTMPDQSKSEILQGTLDLMVLKTLAAMGSLHGYGIARRIEQISEEALQINQGTIYASLVRLLHKGWIAAEWGTSENNRKARFYSITRRGRKQLTQDAAYWQRLSIVMSRVLTMTELEEGES